MSGEASMATAGHTASVNGDTPSNGVLTTSSREEEEMLTDHYGFQYTAEDAAMH